MPASTRFRRAVAFAVPGDPSALTGGTIYDSRLIAELQAAGRRVTQVALPDGFPDPAPSALATVVADLSALPAADPLMIDGLAYGAIPTEALARIAAPLVALVHHPLALETGLAPERAAALAAREAANLGLAAHVLVPSPHTAQVLERDYGVPPDRITVALPGVERPVGAHAPETPPLILSVGLLAARKGHDVLIRALARIADLDWRAVIVGRDHEPGTAEDLAALVGQTGLARRVTLAGEVSAARLSALYRHAALFALASRYEGYGMAFAEALVHGLPIVACRTGAVPDTVPEAAGLLVPPEDVGAFARAMRRVLTDGNLRRSLAEGATAHSARLPDWSGTAALVGEVLDRL